MKVPFGLTQAPAYFQELMTGILKDFNFAIAYLDIWTTSSFSVKQQKNLSMKLSKCHYFTKEIQYLGHIPSTKGLKPLPLKTQAIKNMHLPKMPKQVCPFLGLVGYYRKFIKNFAKIAKPLTLLTHQQCFFNTQGISHPSTSLTLSQSKEMLHSLYRCIQ